MPPIRPMSAVERFLERLLERPSARLFGTRVQPVQVQRRIERAMEFGRRVERRLIRVPDRFTVRLPSADLGALDGAGGLPVELASGALEWARRQGYVLATRPRVAILGSETLRSGDIEVEARFSDTADGSSEPDVADLGHTRIFRAPVVRTPRATIIVRERGGREHTIVTDGGPLTIGRASDNTLTLSDERVSRQHARLQARGGVLILTDLDSTNGMRVNGERYTEVALGEGDVVEVGNTTLTIVTVDDGLADGSADAPADAPRGEED